MKYYTPELEEFHIGFEYEILEDWDTYPEPTWWPQVYGTNGNSPENIGYVDKNTLVDIRVKYLDEQDIKDLGWEFHSTNKMVTWFKGKEEWFGKTIPCSPLYKYWDYLLKFDPKYSSVQIECKTSNGDSEIFFEGIIKNKSELKRLMKQLGI